MIRLSLKNRKATPVAYPVMSFLQRHDLHRLLSSMTKNPCNNTSTIWPHHQWWLNHQNPRRVNVAITPPPSPSATYPLLYNSGGVIFSIHRQKLDPTHVPHVAPSSPVQVGRIQRLLTWCTNRIPHVAARQPPRIYYLPTYLVVGFETFSARFSLSSRTLE